MENSQIKMVSRKTLSTFGTIFWDETRKRLQLQSAKSFLIPIFTLKFFYLFKNRPSIYAKAFMKIVLRIAASITKYEIWIVLATAPFLLFPGGWMPYACLLIYGLIWASRKLSGGHFSQPTNLDIPIIILVLTLLMGYWISIDHDMSWARMWNYLLGVVLFYSLVNRFKPEVHWPVMVILVCLLTIGIVIFSLVATDWSGVRLFSLSWLYDRFPALLRNIPGSGVPTGSDLVNPRWIGIMLGFLLPFLIPFLLFQSSGKFRLILAITVVLTFLDLLMTQSVQGLCGLMAGGLFIVVWRRRKWVFAIPAGAAAGVMLVFLLGAQKTFVYLLSSNNPVGIAVALRLDMWGRAFAMLRDMPFTGIGVNIFSVIQSAFYPGYLIGPEAHAHNLYLQTALDQGIPGLVALLLMIIWWGITIKRNYDQAESRGHKILYVAAAAAVLSFLAAGMMDGMTLGAKPALLVWAMLGIGIAPGMIPIQGQRAANVPSLPWLRVIVPLLITLTTVGAILIFLPYSPYSNMGSLVAQKSLLAANSTSALPVDEMQSGKEYLLKAIELAPENSHLYLMVARLDSWLGNNQSALSFLSRVVMLDARAPFREYYPPGFLIQSIEPQGNLLANWDDLLRIYTQWMTRFPDRAEGYLLCGLASLQGKQVGNEAIPYILRGLDQNAGPRGVLQYSLAFMSGIPDK